MAAPGHGRPKEQWATRIGVILAVAGSAVGLGNFLRFPGNAAQNGGGAFMLPYFISLLLLGIPLCWAEWTMGRYGGLRGFNSAPGIYRSIGGRRISMYFGALALLLPLVIYMYYVLVEAWCLGYAISYLTGDLMPGSGGAVDELIVEAKDNAAGAAEQISDKQATSTAFGEFFNQFIGAAADGDAYSGKNSKWLLVIAGTFIFNFLLIYRGIAKGIETFCRFAMPVMIVLALIVLVRVLTLGTPDANQPELSVNTGLGFMWNPVPEALYNPQTWLAASGQIFFSLSVGFGIIINYSSYLRKKDDVVLSGLTASSMNEFFEVCLGGLITIPAAYIFFLGALPAGERDSFLASTFQMGFIALPNVFASMWGGQVFGFLWFAMLFVAAVTSSVSMLQPVIAFLEEGFGLKRHASAAILGFIALIGCGFVMHFSEGSTALGTFDFWVGTFLIYVVAMFQAILYGWVLGIEKGEQEAHQGAHLRIPRFVQYMLKYVVPVYLIVIFIAFCLSNLPNKQNLEFETSVNVADGITSTALPDGLRSDMASKNLKLADTLVISATGDGQAWIVRENEDAPPAYVLQKTTSQESDRNVLAIYSYSLGTISTIARNRTALLSIGFIGSVLLLLLILIHIAGRRWEAEGRFADEG